MGPQERSGYYFPYKGMLAAIPAADLSSYCGSVLDWYLQSNTKTDRPKACGGTGQNKLTETYSMPIGTDPIYRVTDSPLERDCKERCIQWFGDGTTNYAPVIYSCSKACEVSGGTSPETACSFLSNDVAFGAQTIALQLKSQCLKTWLVLIALIVIVLVLIYMV